MEKIKKVVSPWYTAELPEGFLPPLKKLLSHTGVEVKEDGEGHLLLLTNKQREIEYLLRAIENLAR